jgi:hypothetical protein
MERSSVLGLDWRTGAGAKRVILFCSLLTYLLTYIKCLYLSLRQRQCASRRVQEKSFHFYRKRHGYKVMLLLLPDSQSDTLERSARRVAAGR